MKVIIVGGVAAGASAAARLRRLDERAEITVFEKGKHVSFANCGLPYYVGNVIRAEGSLLLVTPELFKERFNIEVRTEHEVLSIDRARKEVEVKDLKSGRIFRASYDVLVLATGSTPLKPKMEGIDLPGVMTLRSVEDARAIKEMALGGKKVAVVGGGFIGLEAAENLVHLGKEVRLYQLLPQVLPAYDPEVVAYVHHELRGNGVRLHLGAEVQGFAEESGRLTVKVKDGDDRGYDFVLFAIGVRPDSGLAAAAGLELTPRGSIVVDEHLRTSDPYIYAAGDAVAILNEVTGEKQMIALAGPANKEGRIVADNIAGRDSVYRGALGTSILKVFSLAVGMVGIGEKDALRRGIKARSVLLAPADHATYYPGASTMILKLVYEEGSQRILGAQALGPSGVDKRIDVIATAMKSGMKASELKELDLAYAPPFGSAKDPVNMLGFVAENLEDGLLETFHYDEVDALPRDGSITLLDVRAEDEYRAGHIEGFKNIPLDELRERLEEIPSGKKVYLHCLSGLRSYLAARILMNEGYDAYSLNGGYLVYMAYQDDVAARRH